MEENALQTMEMRMLRMIADVTRYDRVRNAYILGSLNITSISTKLDVNRLRWLGHLERRDDSHITRVAENIIVEGKRNRGRPKLTWKHKVKATMAKYQLDINVCKNRNEWRQKLKELTTAKVIAK